MTSVQQRMGFLIDAKTPSKDYEAATLASTIINDHPDRCPTCKQPIGLLGEFLQDMASDTLTSFILRRIRTARSVARRRVKSERFREASRRAEATGDTAPLLGMFEQEFTIAGQQRRVKDMTGRDHQLVAEGYSKRARTYGLESEFHLAVARKVGDKLTGDVYTEAEYEKMYRSVVGR